ncbi:metallothionein-like protein 4B [Tasmannia lanceolata]|uniref:metallothionein-like protein 4B n=1 Tax=Tasmannia lanceolata TaxID=3420 RepID=UPI004063CF01
MADTGRGEAPVCNETCGCAYPCPGGENCKCSTRGGNVEVQHAYCMCGDHCGCNPCTCAAVVTTGVGKAFCKCGEGCSCVPCST